MKKLIVINKQFIGTESVQSVSAKDLYLGLGLDKSNWTKWYSTNIEKNEFFAENKDWVGFVMMTNGNETRDFAITIEFAKHIAMMAKTEKAHDYRNYFIECEKVATGILPVKENQIETARIAPLFIEMAKAFGFEGNQAYLSADRAVKSITGISPLLLMGATLVADERGRTYTPTELGSTFEIKLSGIKINKLLAENGLQYKDDNDDWTPTKLSDGLFEWSDTARKHGDGSPLKQLRWFKDVLGKI